MYTNIILLFSVNLNCPVLGENTTTRMFTVNVTNISQGISKQLEDNF